MIRLAWFLTHWVPNSGGVMIITVVQEYNLFKDGGLSEASLFSTYEVIQ